MAKKRKSYNPFKMWGSWIGASIFLIVITFIGTALTGMFGSPDKFYEVLFRLLTGGMGGGKFNLIVLLLFYGTISLGFLIGWGIHSLIRKFNLLKKKWFRIILWGLGISLLLFILINILYGLILRPQQGTSLESSCIKIYENGKLISDSCKNISPNYFCSSDLSMYSPEVQSGKRIESMGFCKKSNPNSIGI